MKTENGNWAWVARRVAYLAGVAVGVGLIASGRATQEQVDGWLPLVVEVLGALTSLGFAFAASRTGPHSDDSRPVLQIEDVEPLLDAVDAALQYAQAAPGRHRAPEVPPAPTEPPVAPTGPETGAPGTDEADPLQALRDAVQRGRIG